MNIYLVERSKCDYDEYDGFVVAASSDKEALDYLNAQYNVREWPEWPDEGEKTATLVGTTDKYTETTIILSSFNAG